MTLSKNFQATNQNNPCPVCEKTNGNCRILSDDGILCMTFPDKFSGQDHPTYRYTKPTKDGLWGIYYPRQDDDFDREKWLNQLEEQKERKAQRDRDKTIRLKASLTESERDTEIRKIIDDLKNNHPDRKAEILKKKGFSDEMIAASDLVYVEKYQKLSIKVSPDLAGVNGSTNGLTNNISGILCFTKNELGQYTGWQIRDEDPNADHRYKWASSGSEKNKKSSHLRNGELPLSVIDNGDRSGIVALTEGVRLKTDLASNRLNICSIGSAGGLHHNSPRQLKKALEALGTSVVWLCPDAGMLTNKGVMSNYEKTIKLIESWGYTVQVLWWEQYEKGQDIDEVDIEKLKLNKVKKDDETIRFLDYRTFSTMAQLEQAYITSKKLSNARIIHEENLENVEFFIEGKGHGIKMGMGGGKTYSMIMESLTKYFETGLFGVGYRNSLLYNQQAKVKTLSKKLSNKIKAMKHIKDVINPKDLLPSDWLVLCIDSFLKLTDGLTEQQIIDNFTGKHFFLDESVSVLLHCLHSSTLGDKRFDIIDRFKLALRSCKSFVYTDANLCDWVVKILTHWSGKPQELTHNTYSRINAKVTILDGTIEGEKIKKNDNSPMFLDMLQFDSFCVGSDSQIAIESLDEWLQFHGINEQNILRIDGKTTSTDRIKLFLYDPDSYLRLNPNVIVLYTTSAESGLDISIQNYFQKQYGFFFGIISIDSFTQLIGRVRDQSVDKMIWIRSHAISQDDDLTSFYAGANEWYFKQQMMLEANLLGSDFMTAMVEIQTKITNSLSVENETAYELIRLRNYERHNLRRLTINRLRDCGYQLTNAIIERTQEHKNTAQETKKIKNSVKDKNVKDIAMASSEYIGKPLSSLPMDAKWEDQCAQKKARYFDRLPNFWGEDLDMGDGTTEKLYTMDETVLKLLEYQESQLLKKMELLHLVNNLDQAKILGLNRYAKMLESTGIIPWKIKIEYLKIRALSYLDVSGLISEIKKHPIQKNDPILETLMKKTGRDKDRLKVDGERISVKIALGKKPSTDPLIFARNLLEMVGIPVQIGDDQIFLNGTRWNRIIPYYTDLNAAIATRFESICTNIQMDKIQEILRPDLRATVGKPKAPPSKELSLKKSCDFYIKDLPENSPVVIPSKSDNCTTNLDDSCETAPESKEDIPDGQNKVNLDGQNSVVDIHTKIALKGDKIKDKVTGEVFIVESFAKGRYHCIDGKYRLSIPFDDAIAA